MLPNKPITYNESGIKTTRPNIFHSGFLNFSNKDLCDIFAMPKSVVTVNANNGNIITSIGVQLIGRNIVITKNRAHVPTGYCSYCSYQCR